MNILQTIDFSSLNSIDIIVFTITGLSVLFALVRGFIGSMMSLVGWIASIVLTYRLAPLVQPFISQHIKNDLLVVIASYSALAIASLVGFAILNSFVSAFLGFLRGGFLDKALGALFGLFRGMLIISFLFLCVYISTNLLAGNDINKLDEEHIPELVKEAQTYKLLTVGSEMLVGFLPDTFGGRLEDFADKVQASTMDERFVNSMVRKMYQHMTPDEINAIEQRIQELSTQKSEEQIEKETASDLLKHYKEKQASGEKTSGGEIPASDIARLEKVLGKAP